MNLALAVLVVVGFAATLKLLDLSGRAMEVGRCSRECLLVLRDPTLGDDSKERQLQSYSVRLFRLLGILLGGGAVALGVPVVAVWLLEGWGVGSLAGVLSILQRIDFLVAATVLGSLAYVSVKIVRQR